ncbi:MAG TPA: CGNR zinc finger domain-containing protein [Pseudonocardiaceae bacterium]|jgi:predicted RNA-binding Zn ribbon-like protein|nr:CGNR zinc finger domain-containing protein [Pseudonocardiaceae bacterium]
MAVDLVNTFGNGFDRLDGARELHEFLAANGEPEPFEVTTFDWLDVLELRSDLRAVFEAPTEAEAAGLLNELLARSATAPYLHHHEKVGWHLHVSRPDAGWAEWLTSLTATGLAQLLGEGGFDRMRVCAADDCRVVFVEQARNHSQRFCEPTCATRTRVAAFRARRRAEEPVRFDGWL